MSLLALEGRGTYCQKKIKHNCERKHKHKRSDTSKGLSTDVVALVNLKALATR